MYLVEEGSLVVLSQLRVRLNHSKCLHHCYVFIRARHLATLVEHLLQQREAEGEGRCEKRCEGVCVCARSAVQLLDCALRLRWQSFLRPLAFEDAGRFEQTNGAVSDVIG